MRKTLNTSKLNSLVKSCRSNSMTCSHRHERPRECYVISQQRAIQQLCTANIAYLEKRRCSNTTAGRQWRVLRDIFDERSEPGTLSASTLSLARPWAANRNTTIIRQMNEIEWTDRPVSRPTRSLVRVQPAEPSGAEPPEECVSGLDFMNDQCVLAEAWPRVTSELRARVS